MFRSLMSLRFFNSCTMRAPAPRQLSVDGDLSTNHIITTGRPCYRLTIILGLMRPTHNKPQTVLDPVYTPISLSQFLGSRLTKPSSAEAGIWSTSYDSAIKAWQGTDLGHQAFHAPEMHLLTAAVKTNVSHIAENHT
jgi:hypothetical protein